MPNREEIMSEDREEPRESPPETQAVEANGVPVETPPHLDLQGAQAARRRLQQVWGVSFAAIGMSPALLWFVLNTGIWDPFMALGSDALRLCVAILVVGTLCSASAIVIIVVPKKRHGVRGRSGLGTATLVLGIVEFLVCAFLWYVVIGGFFAFYFRGAVL
jgi:hypothetical protein